jgi:hypothetical protein
MSERYQWAREGPDAVAGCQPAARPTEQASAQAVGNCSEGGRRRYRPSYPMDIAVGKHSSV